MARTVTNPPMLEPEGDAWYDVPKAEEYDRSKLPQGAKSEHVRAVHMGSRLLLELSRRLLRGVRNG